MIFASEMVSRNYHAIGVQQKMMFQHDGIIVKSENELEMDLERSLVESVTFSITAICDRSN
jgi:hypothetical protein